MSDKPRSLADALRDASGKTPVPEHLEPAVSYVAPSRRMMRAKTFHCEPAALEQLKALAFHTRKSEQALMREALNDLFTKHGKPRLA